MVQIENKKIGFIGLGNMGAAILKAWLGHVKNVENYVIYDVDPAKVKEFSGQKEKKTRVVDSEIDVVKNSDIIILAVKPNMIKEVCKKISAAVGEKTIVSIAAGIAVADIRKILHNAEIIRVMPNVSLMVGCGAGSVTTDKKGANFDIVLKYFNVVGEFFELPESLFDAVTGLSGSGPAYIFLIIEALADGGVMMGIPRPIAYKLASSTVMGAAKMQLETNKHPGELKDMVTSPKGTTIEGISVLEDEGVRAAMINAVIAASERSKELREEANN